MLILQSDVLVWGKEALVDIHIEEGNTNDNSLLDCYDDWEISMG